MLTRARPRPHPWSPLRTALKGSLLHIIAAEEIDQVITDGITWDVRLGWQSGRAIDYYVGWDIDTNRASFAVLTDEGNIVMHGWYPLWDYHSDIWKKALHLQARLCDDFVTGPFNIARVMAEMIPGSQSGNSKAMDINILASAAMLAHHGSKNLQGVINRSWMSKTCGLDGRKNPSKEQIVGWCHRRWPDLKPIPHAWIDDRVISRGPRKGFRDYKYSDIYDALGIAEFARLSDGNP